MLKIGCQGFLVVAGATKTSWSVPASGRTMISRSAIFACATSATCV